jgi:hypothetical protein
MAFLQPSSVAESSASFQTLEWSGDTHGTLERARRRSQDDVWRASWQLPDRRRTRRTG